MNNFPVIKGSSYVLAFTPDMIMHSGTTQTTEKVVNPDSEYLRELPKHYRTYEEVVSYIPNQVYIGNATYDDLGNTPFPFYDKKWENAKSDGAFGSIVDEEEFYGTMHISDVFELVLFEPEFAKRVKEKLEKRKFFTEAQLEKLVADKSTASREELERLVNEEHAEGLYINLTELVGVIKRAHDVDVNLSAHVMLENLVAKASNVIALIELVKKNNIKPEDIDYVIDCCEEACGDMNQRGGGNFAKASAETAGYTNATGSDIRGFCAGPAHAMIHAASLVHSGTFKNVVVSGGGCTAKLGMNGKDHVKKGLPVLEDCVASFAILVSENDGIHPVIRTDIVGSHKIGTGSAPQMVITALVGEPLTRAGLKFTDIDKYAPELQNPDITKPAGAGDVPEANYKMIAALAVMKKEIERSQIADFVKKHGMTGWAPTQGHIPSGVPYLGHLIKECLDKKTKRAMIVGKGSLFLGRLTNLFDGVSFIVEANEGSGSVEHDIESSNGNVFKAKGTSTKGINVAYALEGSEHGSQEARLALKIAASKGIDTVLCDGADAHSQMEKLLGSGEAQAAVTMHYPFPIGVSTVGKVITPAKGKPMYIANTTGTSDTDRVAALVKNAIAGIIAAKADGVERPTVGIANIDGARACAKILRTLKDNGYDIDFADSARADGGVEMRGNDLLMGSCDVMVMDALTGNLMMKLFSSYTTGGQYESVGYGYGPGIGEGYDKLIMIVSRASGAPVVAGAVEYAANLIANDWKAIAKAEYAAAHKAGLDALLSEISSAKKADIEEEAEVVAPPKEVCTEAIAGIEVMDLEDAVKTLWKAGVYAESGMGCTGPIIQIAPARLEQSMDILRKAGYIE